MRPPIAIPNFQGAMEFCAMNTDSQQKDQKADVNDPTSKEHKDALDNRSRQLDPKQPEYQQSRGEQTKAK